MSSRRKPVNQFERTDDMGNYPIGRYVTIDLPGDEFHDHTGIVTVGHSTERTRFVRVGEEVRFYCIAVLKLNNQV